MGTARGARTNPMLNRAFARALALVHTAYILFVVLGALLVLQWPVLLPVHVLAVMWAGATLIGDLGCPLTAWEKARWERGGRDAYPEGFLQHHVLRTSRSPWSARRTHAALGAGVIALNIVVYVATGIV